MRVIFGMIGHHVGLRKGRVVDGQFWEGGEQKFQELGQPDGQEREGSSPNLGRPGPKGLSAVPGVALSPN